MSKMFFNVCKKSTAKCKKSKRRTFLERRDFQYLLKLENILDKAKVKTAINNNFHILFFKYCNSMNNTYCNVLIY